MTRRLALTVAALAALYLLALAALAAALAADHNNERHDHGQA